MTTTPSQPSGPDFDKTLALCVGWIRTHQERFWAITGTSLMTVALFAFLIHHRSFENENAWSQLGTIQGQLMQGRMEETRKGLDEWSKRYASTGAGSYAQFLKADLMIKTSDYVSAAQIYSALAQNAQPTDLRPLALAGQASAEEMAGHLPQALSAAQNFTDRYPDHFMAGTMYLSQARANELLGNSGAASAVYDRMTILYPQSPWTPLARARLQALAGKGAATPAPKS